jgi:hypothetical protein
MSIVIIQGRFCTTNFTGNPEDLHMKTDYRMLCPLSIILLFEFFRTSFQQAVQNKKLTTQAVNLSCARFGLIKYSLSLKGNPV